MLCGIMVGVEDNLFVFDETREGHWDVLLLINTYKHIHAHTRTLWLLLYGSKQAKCLSCAATVGNSLLLRPRALQERAGALAVYMRKRSRLAPVTASQDIHTHTHAKFPPLSRPEGFRKSSLLPEPL